MTSQNIYCGKGLFWLNVGTHDCALVLEDLPDLEGNQGMLLCHLTMCEGKNVYGHSEWRDGDNCVHFCDTFEIISTHEK